METTFIYALKDPETGEVRYVGKSSDLKERLRCHLKDGNTKKHNHRIHWINSLKVKGLVPVLEIIDEVPLEHWPQWEVAYLEFFLEQGCNLVNGTSGGEGAGSGEKHPNFGKPGWMQGKRHSIEARAKCRAARLKQIIAPETYVRAALKRLGIKKSWASSSFHGVCWVTSRKRWKASISVAGVPKNLGRFSNEIEAARAYDEAAKKYCGKFAVLNFP